MHTDDRKPDNVLLDADLRCKIADLGLAYSNTAFDVKNIQSLEQRRNEEGRIQWTAKGGTPPCTSQKCRGKHLFRLQFLMLHSLFLAGRHGTRRDRRSARPQFVELWGLQRQGIHRRQRILRRKRLAVTPAKAATSPTTITAEMDHGRAGRIVG